MDNIERIETRLDNGNRIVVEHDTDPRLSNELYIGVVDANGVWIQDIAVVRSMLSTDKFEVLVYADAYDEDYTNRFVIDTYRGA